LTLWHFLFRRLQPTRQKKANEENCTCVEEEKQSPAEKNEKITIPAIVYWIAFESRDGSPVLLVNLNRQMLNCKDVTIKTIKVLNTNSKQATSNEIRRHLWIALKDHSSSYMAQLVHRSFQMCFIKSTLDMELDRLELIISSKNFKTHKIYNTLCPTF